MADNIASEFEMFRLGKMINSYEEDNVSAHYSNNQSYPQFSDRGVQTNSARSMHIENNDGIKKQLAMQYRDNKELADKYQLLEARFRESEERNRILQEKLKEMQEDNLRLNAELSKTKEKEKGTKGKLREWVLQAKQNLNQI